MKKKSLKLSDNTINQLQVCLQMAILTGTDIVDQFRMLRLVVTGDTLELDPSYTKSFKENVDTSLSIIYNQMDGNEGKQIDNIDIFII